MFRFEYIGENNQVYGRPINCLGYVIHHNRTTLRKALIKRIRGKALRVHKKKRCTLRDASAIVSYSGWLKHTDTYDYYYVWIKPNVSYRYCKHKLSKHAKRSNEHDKLDYSA